MPDRLEVADVVCPASTPPTAPVEVPLNFPGGILRRVHVIIPDGHAGLTGIALGYGHTPVWPRQPGTFISGNDERFDFEYIDRQPGVAWSAFVCNNDLQQHKFEVRFEYDESSGVVAAALPTPVPVGAIYGAAASSPEGETVTTVATTADTETTPSSTLEQG